MTDLTQAHQDYTDAMRDYVSASAAHDRLSATEQRRNNPISNRWRKTKMNYDISRVYYFALLAGDPVHIATAKASLYGS